MDCRTGRLWGVTRTAGGLLLGPLGAMCTLPAGSCHRAGVCHAAGSGALCAPYTACPAGASLLRSSAPHRKPREPAPNRLPRRQPPPDAQDGRHRCRCRPPVKGCRPAGSARPKWGYPARLHRAHGRQSDPRVRQPIRKPPTRADPPCPSALGLEAIVFQCGDIDGVRFPIQQQLA